MHVLWIGRRFDGTRPAQQIQSSHNQNSSMPTTYKRQRARQILTQSGGSDDKEEGPSNWVDSQEKSQDTQDEDFQTQGFEYHESDSEQLWEVEEIMEESKGRFLVKWAGTDDRGNPWDNSWVPREDVTDDLVAEWREKKAKEKEKKRKEKAASRRRTVTKSKCSLNLSSQAALLIYCFSAIYWSYFSRILRRRNNLWEHWRTHAP